MYAQPVPIMTTNPNYTGVPMMGMGYMPPNLMNTPNNFVFFNDPMTELANSSGAVIRQEPEILEAVTGCEMQNRYHVFLETMEGLKYAFKCNERSGSCARCCCSPTCRPLELYIRHIISLDYYQKSENFAKIFVRVDKPCEMGCCCLCRPHMDVRLADNNRLLGKIREPCTCCDYDTEIYDAIGNLKYEITGDCCQFGLCCGPDVEKLASIKFDILQNGHLVGSMKKLSSSFGEFFTKADSYQISFPPNATPEEKMLFIISGLMIDYQFFENNDSSPPAYSY